MKAEEYIDKDKIVFLAEDDMDDQEMLTEALKERKPSLQFLVANTGSKAFNMLKENAAKNICVIILDYNLPEMSGAEILSRLKEQNLFPDIPKVVWSTSNSPVYEKKCLEQGAHSYIVKPTGVAGIRQVVDEIARLCNR